MLLVVAFIHCVFNRVFLSFYLPTTLPTFLNILTTVELKFSGFLFINFTILKILQVFFPNISKFSQKTIPVKDPNFYVRKVTKSFKKNKFIESNINSVESYWCYLPFNWLLTSYALKYCDQGINHWWFAWGSSTTMVGIEFHSWVCCWFTWAALSSGKFTHWTHSRS
jgi:hypothetical protein